MPLYPLCFIEIRIIPLPIPIWKSVFSAHFSLLFPFLLSSKHTQQVRFFPSDSTCTPFFSPVPHRLFSFYGNTSSFMKWSYHKNSLHPSTRNISYRFFPILKKRTAKRRFVLLLAVPSRTGYVFIAFLLY